jgi:hypothetical protein
MIIRRVSVRSQREPTLLSKQILGFAANGTGIPDVNFDLGEPYAGLLPTGDDNDTNQLYFWFFPSTNPAAEKEIANLAYWWGKRSLIHYYLLSMTDFCSLVVHRQES